MTQREPLVFDAGPERVRRIGIVSGSAAKLLPQAVELGLDAFLTGEPAEHVMADAREAGIHFIAAGHYATETFGVRRLGDLLAEHSRDRPRVRRHPESGLSPNLGTLEPISVVGVQTTRYLPVQRGKPHRRDSAMAIHLTPTELAREAGMERRQVIEKCMELGVPIFQGRIDKTLFLANLSEQAATATSPPRVATA